MFIDFLIYLKIKYGFLQVLPSQPSDNKFSCLSFIIKLLVIFAVKTDNCKHKYDIYMFKTNSRNTSVLISNNEVYPSIIGMIFLKICILFVIIQNKYTYHIYISIDHIRYGIYVKLTNHPYGFIYTSKYIKIVLIGIYL